VVEPLSSPHLDAVVQLHLRSLTGLLRSLGFGATRAYYRGSIRSDRAVAFVDLHQGRVGGFVVGSMNPGELRREILIHNLAETMIGTLVGFARNPPSAVRFLRSVLARGDKGYDTQAAELTYLAVDEEFRGAGIGKRLVEAFGQSIRKKGAAAYELSVDADNLRAIGFYKNLGFLDIGEYREFGSIHKRYRKELGSRDRDVIPRRNK